MPQHTAPAASAPSRIVPRLENRGFSCSDCGRRWTGLVECHCAASCSAALAVWRCNPEMTASLDSSLLQRTPDRGGVRASKARNLLSTVALPVERGERLRVVAAMLAKVFLGREDGQVGFGVVGFHVVDVMNMLTRPNRSGHDSVFVSLNIVPDTNMPAQANVAAGGLVSAWFEIGHSLARFQSPNGGSLVAGGFSAVSADALLRSAGDEGAAITAWLSDSESHIVIVTQWGCHAHFTNVGNFDRHRVGTYKPYTRRCLSAKEMARLPRFKQTESVNGKSWCQE